MPISVAIAAVSGIKPARYPNLDGYDLYLEVVRQFLSEWSLKPGDIQGLLACPSGMASGSGADIFVHEQLYEELGIHPLFADTTNAGGSTYGLMVQRAALAIRQGLIDSVSCICAPVSFPKWALVARKPWRAWLATKSMNFPTARSFPRSTPRSPVPICMNSVLRRSNWPRWRCPLVNGR